MIIIYDYLLRIEIIYETFDRLLTVLMSARSMDTVIAPIVTNSHTARTPISFEQYKLKNLYISNKRFVDRC